MTHQTLPPYDSSEEFSESHFPQLNATIELIDYGGGNTGSVTRAFQRFGVVVHQVSSPTEISGLHPIVLPGVSTFGSVMQHLAQQNLIEALQNAIAAKVPFLGICVGLQVLFEASEESPGVDGLGILKGTVQRFPQTTPTGEKLKVPQIGWNHLKAGPVFDAKTSHVWPAPQGDKPLSVYFVNSYVAVPQNPEIVLYTADYGQSFCAAVSQDQVTAFQFHPEKSGYAGHQLLWLWLNSILQDAQAQ
jgi:imidazole glycerol phosphate synthase glutamine amidotransferase subunit